MNRLADRIALLALWAGVLGVALATRPLLPVDETRYASVAWEMWSRGDFLVPWLNGEPYAHKPPLLFWLIQAGWALFGVNDWWPRLVSPLVGLLCLGLTARLARRLWPDRTQVAMLAPWVLFGTLFFTFFYTLLQFDLLLAACVLLGMLGLLAAARGRRAGFGVMAVAIGLGGLAKGPVILLHLLPVALLGFLWTPRARAWGWYGGVGLAVLGGAAMALAWALPAAQAGGEAYREAIFWGQTAGRVVKSFAHRQPWWWYLPWLPVLLMPWMLWRAAWARPSGGERTDVRPLAFLAAWLLPVFVAFSLVSGKQLKYLLPLLPGAVLLVAWLLTGRERPVGARWTLALYLGMAGLLLGALPVIAGQRGEPLLAAAPVWPGIVLVALGLLCLLVWRPASVGAGVRALTLGSALIVVLAHLGPVPALAPAYDLAGFALAIARAQASGVTVAHVGKYHGQFHFLGRLEKPLVVIPATRAKEWAARHPEALVVVYREQFRPPLPPDGARRVQDYRGDREDLMLWRAADLARVLQKRQPG